MMFHKKNITFFFLNVLLLPANFYAAVGTIAGTISVQTNTNNTVSLSIVSGKNFSVPSQVPLQLNALCPATGTGTSLWQVVIAIPVTLKCPCPAGLNFSTGIETNLFTTPLATSDGTPILVLDYTVAINTITTSSFVLNISILLETCPQVSAPISTSDVINALIAGQPTAVSFAAFCVR